MTLTQSGKVKVFDATVEIAKAAVGKPNQSTVTVPDKEKFTEFLQATHEKLTELLDD
jgi:hypothetical protein